MNAFSLVAAANQDAIWQAAEVWLEDGAVVAINDLGEGPPTTVCLPCTPGLVDNHNPRQKMRKFPHHRC